MHKDKIIPKIHTDSWNSSVSNIHTSQNQVFWNLDTWVLVQIPIPFPKSIGFV